MRTTRRAIRLTTLVSAGALLLAACGGDDDAVAPTVPSETAAPTETTEPGTTEPGTTEPDGGGTPSAPGREDAIAAAVAAEEGNPLVGTPGSGLTRGVTDDVVRVGCIYEAANYSGYEDGVRAAFHRVSEVNGRTFELLPCEDDAADPAQHLQIARRLVEQDEVFAIVTAAQSTSPSVATYLNENEVPYLGWGFNNTFCAMRWGHGFDGCLNGAFSEDVPRPYLNPYLVQPMIDASGIDPADIRAAIIGSDSDGGRAGNENYTALFESAGATVVYVESVIPVPGPTTDYTPFVQAALADDPNIVLVSTAFGDVGGLTAALKASGYDGAIMNFVAYVPGLLDAVPELAAALDGTYVLASLVPQEQQNEYIMVVEGALEESGAESGRFITFGASLGFLMGDQLASMVAVTGEDLDTATFDETVNGGGFVYRSPGQGGPCSIPFPGAKFFSASGSALVQVNDGSFEVVSPYTCYAPAPMEQ